MLYTSSKDTLKKKLNLMGGDIQATDAAEIDYNTVLEKVKLNVKWEISSSQEIMELYLQLFSSFHVRSSRIVLCYWTTVFNHSTCLLDFYSLLYCILRCCLQLKFEGTSFFTIVCTSYKLISSGNVFRSETHSFWSESEHNKCEWYRY